jgi:hypothetical protein
MLEKDLGESIKEVSKQIDQAQKRRIANQEEQLKIRKKVAIQEGKSP